MASGFTSERDLDLDFPVSKQKPSVDTVSFRKGCSIAQTLFSTVSPRRKTEAAQTETKVLANSGGCLEKNNQKGQRASSHHVAFDSTKKSKSHSETWVSVPYASDVDGGPKGEVG